MSTFPAEFLCGMNLVRYTSLIQLDDGRAMVTYDLIKTKEFAASFSMEFDVA